MMFLHSWLKDPCFISITRWLYNRFFSFSFRSKFFCRVEIRWLGANQFKHPYIKNALWLSCQNRRTLTSRRASLAVFAHVWRCSPVKGISAGSVATSLWTSLMVLAKKSRTRSCLWWMNPAFAHDRAWSTSYAFPHGHIVGNRFNLHLYRIAMAS